MQRQDDFWTDTEGQAPLIARNVVMEYVAIGVNLALGVGMLPFNIRHLGQSAYGLWVLVTSLTTYFSMLDLGYGSAQVKFAARYRARRDPQALNEIASTLFFLFLGIAIVTYVAAVVMSLNLSRMFKLTPDQIATGRDVLLIISLYVALGFPFSVYGGVVNGFQRYYRNNIIAIATSVIVAAVNVAVLLTGHGIVGLVAATTAVRIASFAFYRQTAHSAFPLLSVRWKYVRVARLREITGFSVFLLLIDIAGKINYSADVLVIGAFMSTAAIAVWSVAVRVVDIAYMLTNVLTRFLFPVVVESATQDRVDRLQLLLVQGTRLSLAMVVPLTVVTAILAYPAVMAWVGPKFVGSVPIIWILSGVVATRVATTTASTVLKGCERHKFLAWCIMGIAVANLGLSILFVRRWGLVGVAVGTLTPVVIVSDLLLLPAACRRVDLSVGRLLRTAVWPALWPIVPVGGLLILARPLIGTSPIWIVLSAIVSGLLYLAIFVGAALEQEDRQWYIDKAALVSRRALPIAT